ncbi:MAG: hypothetical protein LBI35_05160 [Burkholderiales bacterium]|jgi:hypothetical protein|nr:hypothetical protein [Burkholderiales bacterium]
MDKNEFLDFSKALDAAYEGVGKPPMGSAGKAVVFQSLADVSFSQFTLALTAHLSDEATGMFAPTAAHIRAQLSKFREADGRPTVEEAWAIAIAGQDEMATVVMSDDIAAALGICRPILDAGDEVGARMAFKEAYTRLVREARAGQKPVNWFPSLGHDPQGREQALLEAYRLNRLSKAQVAGLLPSVPSRYAMKALPPPKSEEEAQSREYIAAQFAKLSAVLKRGSNIREVEKVAFRERENARKEELRQQTEARMVLLEVT